MLMHLDLKKMGQPFFRQFLSFIDFLKANRRFTSDYLDTTIMTKETQDQNGMKANLFVDKLVNVKYYFFRTFYRKTQLFYSDVFQN